MSKHASGNTLLHFSIVRVFDLLQAVCIAIVLLSSFVHCTGNTATASISPDSHATMSQFHRNLVPGT